MTIAVGFFDGVHLGHRAILEGSDLALTFQNHPLSVLAPARAPRLIMTCAERRAALEALGVAVTMLPFDAALAGESPEGFLARLLAIVAGAPPPRGEATSSSLQEKRLSIRCGANWRFGKGGVGDAAWLRAHGVDVTVVPYAEYKGAAVSSTRIRRALEAGEIEDANAMLGRPYAVSGEVVSGKGLGRTLGYPTINVVAACSLPCGVYVVEVGGRRAVANYGRAPTMGARAWKAPVWELHLLAPADGFVPPRTREGAVPPLRFAVLRHLRPERKFASVGELTAQIARDCRAALEVEGKERESE